MRAINFIGILLLLSPLTGATSAVEQFEHFGEDSTLQESILVDDFENYRAGDIPHRWFELTPNRELVRYKSEFQDGKNHFHIRSEGNRKFLRGTTNGGVVKVIMPFNEPEADKNWRLSSHPSLQWQWRALDLPEGGREDQRSKNDVAAAVYVTFGSDWLGRPISIKYTYSTTLPVGTVLSQGPLRVMVVSSGKQSGTGDWRTIQRNVKEDYLQAFGSDPPQDPISITLWSDSDTIANARSKADFDNIKLQPSRR